MDLERSLPPYLYDIEIYQDRQAADPLHVDCLLGRTNVKYIIRPTPADSAATRALGDVFNGSPMPSRLYEDLCFVPRTYVAGNSLFSTNSAETLDHLASPDFDALNTVILAATPGSAPDVATLALQAGAPGDAGLKPGATTAVAAAARRPSGNRAPRSQLRHPSRATRAPRLRRPAGSIRSQLAGHTRWPTRRPSSAPTRFFAPSMPGPAFTKSALTITSGASAWE